MTCHALPKPLFLAFMLTALCPFLRAESPFATSVKTERLSGAHYRITVQFLLRTGVHIYREADSSLGLEPLRMQWEGAQVTPQGGLRLLDGKVERLADPLFDHKPLAVLRGNFTLQQDILIGGAVPDSIDLLLTGFAAETDQFNPIEERLRIGLEGGEARSGLKLEGFNLRAPLGDCGEDIAEGTDSLWLIFAKGMAGGLLALLMPCIFPMIPVTVSFFMHRSASRREGIRNGLLYGNFIFLVYLIASLPFHLAGNINPQIFNTISTNQWVNLAFFLIFVLFALSLFGLFELRLPGAWANTTGQKGGLATTAGIFFMALTLAIVSFSCTGPILGILLVNSIGEGGNGAWALTSGMAGFGLALALPFALYALFPQWMKRLPRSGGWMDRLKVALGFIELALAIKFLSNADLVEHWGLLPREIFVLLWFLLALGLAIYLFRILPMGATGRWRPGAGAILSGLLAIAAAAYLFGGLLPSGRQGLKLLSGLAPPASYSLYPAEKGSSIPEPQFTNRYEEALALAKTTGKPVLLDFTGWACVNCRKMEELVWSKPEVSWLIREKFILVSLYVDDRKPLPSAEQGTYRDATGQLRQLKTLGDKWAGFQALNFGQVTQPLYALISPDGKLMSHPVGYTPNAADYAEWLRCGLKTLNQSTRR